MAKPKDATYGQLCQLLLRLGFLDESVKGSHRAFRHADSDTLILFGEYYKRSTPLRDEDLVSVRRHLDEKGFVDADTFGRLFSAKKRSGINAQDRRSGA